MGGAGRGCAACDSFSLRSLSSSKRQPYVMKTKRSIVKKAWLSSQPVAICAWRGQGCRARGGAGAEVRGRGTVGGGLLLRFQRAWGEP